MRRSRQSAWRPRSAHCRRLRGFAPGPRLPARLPGVVATPKWFREPVHPELREGKLAGVLCNLTKRP